MKPTIETISAFDSRIWDIDADRYTDTTISLLLACKHALVVALGRANRPSDVLVTKIMLGVFGNVPAFDTYFRRGFGLSGFSARSLAAVASFYQEHRAELDSYRITTLDFTTGQSTVRRYPLAKLIDMVGFIEGSLGETAAPESLIRD